MRGGSHTQSAAAAPLDAGWEDILENWGQHAGSAEVRERILAGVPTSHLGRLWFTALAAASHGSSGGNMDVVGSDQDTATLFECAVQEAAGRRQDRFQTCCDVIAEPTHKRTPLLLQQG